jgi:hypothetical protein
MTIKAFPAIPLNDGKVVWDNTASSHWSEDVLQIVYDHCIIDLGLYSADTLIISVVERKTIDDEQIEAWAKPVAVIPCADRTDMLMQLERAIRVYPSMLCRSK